MPEMLVRNLVASEEVFRSRSMTAGVPCCSLAVGDRFDYPGKVTSQYGFLLHRMTSLSSISEQASIEEMGHEEQFPPILSADNSSESEESEFAEPDFIRPRQQSVVTAATSVSGPSGSPNLSKAAPVHQQDQGTWYSDDNDDSELTMRVRKRAAEPRSWLRHAQLRSRLRRRGQGRVFHVVSTL